MKGSSNKRVCNRSDNDDRFGSSEDDDEVSDAEESEETEEDLAIAFFLFAKARIESGENAAFPKALTALKQCRTVILERNVDLKRLKEKAMKRDINDTRVPPGSSLVKRTLSDERFLLCVTDIQIAKLCLFAGDSKGSLDSLKEALMWFPRSIEANYLLAELLRANAETKQTMQLIELLFRKAIETGELLKSQIKEAKSKNPLQSKVSSAYFTDATFSKSNEQNKCASSIDSIEEEELHRLEIEADEIAAALSAEQSLSIFLCQGGRCSDAVPYLVGHGFKWRLSSQVFEYKLEPELLELESGVTSAIQSSSSIVNVVENALDKSMISHLQYVFRADSPYWSEHNYDATILNASRTIGYYSYIYQLLPSYNSRGNDNNSSTQQQQLQCKPKRSCSIEQIIDRIYPLVCQYFPLALEATCGESSSSFIDSYYLYLSYQPRIFFI